MRQTWNLFNSICKKENKVIRIRKLIWLKYQFFYMSHKNNRLIWSRGIKENSESNNMWKLFGLDKQIYYRVKRARQIIWLLGKKCWQGQKPSQFRSNHWNFSRVRASELFSALLNIMSKNHAGSSARSSHLTHGHAPYRKEKL